MQLPGLSAFLRVRRSLCEVLERFEHIATVAAVQCVPSKNATVNYFRTSRASDGVFLTCWPRIFRPPLRLKIGTISLVSGICVHFSDRCGLNFVRKMCTNIGQGTSAMSDISNSITSLVNAAGPGPVWVPADFAHLGSRDAIDKTLQRLVASEALRRIDRGLYDLPATNRLTRRPMAPDYRAVVDAIARRDQLHMLVDGMTAANDLGLTDAVPARVTIHTDARRRSIQVDNLLIEFRKTAPSRLYWAGRPAMRVVQALHWLKDTLPGDGDRTRTRLGGVLSDPKHGPAISQDLVQGFAHLPAWMQAFLRTVPSFDPSPVNAGVSHLHANADRARRSPAAGNPAGGSQ
jgi:hypothetical protein